MTTRTTQTIVSFSIPFALPGFSSPLPAGDYRVDHDEVMIGGNVQVGWVRTATYVHLPAIGVRASTHQMVPIERETTDATVWNTIHPE
ncbi:hypothetical protein [Pelagibacterium lentulum]|uniref:Uncharacterized protein n=1 Tax=Pelagibacterium lentulum TaxID=2029865 RepID=A0A916RN80_9HYPH|nr:hypothetical protein [Pelagibacterium lentulum]GGA62466.1 hypothetical protein GCM10011499_36050 [Pelagibacterium lentulum]